MAEELPVVFIHGQPGVGSDFNPLRNLLGPPFSVIAPDRPGYGSNPLSAVSMRANADWFASQLQTAASTGGSLGSGGSAVSGGSGVSGVTGGSGGSGRAILVGHSYGGGIAVLLAAEYPDLVAGVVLAASIGSGEHLGVVDRALAVPVLGELLFAGGIGAAGTVLPFIRSRSALAPERIGRWLSVSLPDRGFIRHTSTARTWSSAVHEQRALLRGMSEVEKALPHLHCPVEVVAGSWDIIVSPSIAAKIASSIPGAQLLIVARTGHFLTRDAPAVLAASIRRVAAKSGWLPFPSGQV